MNLTERPYVFTLLTLESNFEIVHILCLARIKYVVYAIVILYSCFQLISGGTPQFKIQIQINTCTLIYLNIIIYYNAIGCKIVSILQTLVQFWCLVDRITVHHQICSNRMSSMINNLISVGSYQPVT